MEKIVSPVAIDVGAAHTGVQCVHGCIGHGGLKLSEQPNSNIGTCINLSKQITFFQQGRTAVRHRVRTLQRRKLAKRLFDCIVRDKGLDPSGHRGALGFAYGLLNRRGFTFTQKDSKLEIFDREDIRFVLGQVLKNELGESLSGWDLQQKFVDFLQEQLEEGFPLELLEKWTEAAEDLKKRPQSWQDALAQEATDKDEAKKLGDKAWTEFSAYLAGIKEDLGKGAKHRKQYLKNIHEDIKICLEGCYDEPSRNSLNYHLGQKVQRLMGGLDISEEGFYRLLGNLSNLQLRVLRKYFNRKAFQKDLEWEGQRLHKLLSNAVQSWHCEGSEDRARRRELLASLERSQDVFSWLCTTDPVQTIPPYEDQNNRRPPKCATLYLSPEGLDHHYSSWMDVVRRLIQSDKLGLEKDILLPQEPSGASDRRRKARILQRVLDTSKALDPYHIRELCWNRDKKRDSRKEVSDEKLLAVFNNDGEKVDAFLCFAQGYYDEVKRARRGLWEGGKSENGWFYRCDRNPPQKNKLSHVFINQQLGSCLKAEDVQIFREKIWEQKLLGRQSLKGFAAEVSDLRKSCGNHFKTIFVGKHLNQSSEEQDKAFRSLFVKLTAHPDYFARMLELLHQEGLSPKGAGPKDRDPNSWRQAEQLYVVDQLYQILEKDIHGFSKDCQACARENGWRMEQAEAKDDDMVARASRLVKDSVRPFDGFLGRWLERLAHEVAQGKWQQLSQMPLEPGQEVYVPVLLEENRFEFEEGLKTAKQKDSGNISKNNKNSKDKKESPAQKDERFFSEGLKRKEERIKKAGKGLCPYCGKSVIMGQGGGGDVDHIIPRQWSMKHYRTVFNGEMNLILSHEACNRNFKGGKLPTFSDLNPSYLKAVFGKDDVEKIQKEIREVVNPFVARESKLVNFLSLKEAEQRCLRHALFIADEKLRNGLIYLLNTRIKTMVNGTQAWLGKLIRRELQSLSRESGIKIDCQFFQIPLFDDNVTKAKREEDIEKKKELWQDSPSVVASRRLLGLHNDRYAKEERQQSSSHIIDAAMVLGTVLRSPRLLREVLEAGAVDAALGLDAKGLRELADRQADKFCDAGAALEGLLPGELSVVKEIQRRPVTDGKHLWEKAVFKATIYGEDFQPLLIKPDGSLSYGYIEPHSNKEFVTPLKLPKKTSAEELFTLLAPYLRRYNKGIKLSFSEYLAKAKEKERPLFFTVHKEKYFTFCEDVFYSRNGHQLRALSDEERSIISTMNTLLFTFARGEESDKKAKAKYFEMAKSQRETISREMAELCSDKLRKQRQMYREIISYIDQNKLRDKEKLEAEDWDFLKKYKGRLFFGSVVKNKKIAEADALEKIFEKITEADEKQKYPDKLQTQVEQSLLRKRKVSQRQHKPVPTTLSFKQGASPSGTLLRVRRKDPWGQAVYQAVVGGDNQESFSIVKGISQEGSNVLLSKLSKDCCVTPQDFLGTKKEPKWLPYLPGMKLEQEQRDQTPYELTETPSGISKIICNPKNKKESQWILQLYFTAEQFLEFQDKTMIEATGEGENLSFKSDESKFCDYFGKTSRAKQPKEVKINVSRDREGYYVASFFCDPASVRKCFNLTRPEEPGKE